ncbi:cyclin-dependent protein kinase inhibitor SMR10-like [Hibiscus syriacus]|uniref:cyclin-dependent protein kinase inhibitor SMR10-like n=1 Tax=Hibiscus syriacus TaxID=106335 RepID=UPI00192251FA|nr:cyclin-dependent protein kinase inhibitor SMR10-like [Hibiscus syriacus]
MPNSELILVKDRIEFDILKRPALEFQEECLEAKAINTSSNDVPISDGEERQLLEDDEEKKGEESEKKNISLGEFKAMVDEDDGFKTPTSLDYKIPEMKQCPPAPRKPKATKRRASPSSSGTANASTCRNLQLHLSQAVASLVDDLHSKVKKARIHEN